MSRIKLNFWCPDREKMFIWRDNFEEICFAKGQLKPVLNNSVERNWDWYKYDYVPLQYTGIKDKKGKEICEGDIVAYLDSSEPVGYSYKREEFCNFGQAIWDQEYARFDITNREDVDAEDVWDESYLEVIGNIYENPTLLEKMQNQYY